MRNSPTIIAYIRCVSAVDLPQEGGRAGRPAVPAGRARSGVQEEGVRVGPMPLPAQAQSVQQAR